MLTGCSRLTPDPDLVQSLAGSFQPIGSQRQIEATEGEPTGRGSGGVGGGGGPTTVWIMTHLEH